MNLNWIGRVTLWGSYKFGQKNKIGNGNLWFDKTLVIFVKMSLEDKWYLAAKDGYVVDQKDGLHIDINNYIKSKFLKVKR